MGARQDQNPGTDSASANIAHYSASHRYYLLRARVSGIELKDL
jgi:hypothetical protein